MHQADEALQLSVVIITLNEEKRLEACLASLPSGAEVIVLDSGSSDGTAAVAKRAGARFATQAFVNHAEQKNAALAMATRPWVLSIDADEVLDATLRRDIARVTRATTPATVCGFRLKRRLIFLGQPLRFGKAVDYPVRLCRRGSGNFMSAIHERLTITGGAIENLNGELQHHSYEDLTDYFDRFNQYTTLIAANHRKQQKAMPPLVLHVLRPWAEFVYRYFLRLGLLDGYPGYSYALLSALYTFVKYAKLKELAVATKSGNA